MASCSRPGTCKGDDAAQAVQVVDAVLDALFKEVIEKGAADRAKKEQQLLKLQKEREPALKSEREKLHSLEQFMDEIAHDLKKIELEKQRPT